MLDSNAPQTINSSDVPKALADPGTVTSNLDVGMPGFVQDVNVTITLTHSYDSDLTITLIAPNGQQVLLASGEGGSGDNYTGTVFDDQAANFISSGTAPFTGSFRPEAGHPLSALNGIVAGGTWKLQIYDYAAPDTGSLTSWSLTLTTGEQIATSDSSGNYVLSNITQGSSYIVREVAPAGYKQTAPAGGSYSGTVNGPATGKDFGNGPLSISGQVYVDANGNGAKDSGETGQAGVTVYLDANSNSMLDSNAPQTINSSDVPKALADPGTVTSNLDVSMSGFVQDVNVTLTLTHTYDGDLTITLIAPNGQQVLLASREGSSGHNFTGTVFDDQAANYISSGTAPFTGSFKPEFGHPLSALNGIVPNGTWKLQINDALAPDTGSLSSWSLTLTTGEQIATSDSSGNYVLSNITQGSGYTVREVVPAGYKQTAPAGGSYSGTFNGPITGKDFGNAPLSISGQVYVDANGNGVKDGGEIGQAGVTVYLDADGNSMLNGAEQSAISDSSGNYVLSNLTQGSSYTVREVLPSSYVLKAPAGGSYSGTVNGPLTGKDFGNLPLSVSGQVYADANGNGVKDTGETGQAGVTVYLDANSNGILDTTTQTLASTDVPKTIPNGGTITSTISGSGLTGVIEDLNVSISITHPTDGNLTVTLIAPTGQQILLVSGRGGSGNNFTNTVFDDQASIPLQSGGAPFTGSFIPAAPLAAVMGLVPNGTWTLKVTDSGSGATGTITGWSLILTSGETISLSDSLGNYTLQNFTQGSSYTVREVLPGGYLPTGPAGGFYSGTVNGPITGKDIANAPLSMSGQVYADANGNGMEDSGETGLAGVAVYLDANGNGSFDGTTQSFTSPNVPKTISDYGTATSTQPVSGLTGNVQDVNVSVDITHTYDGDLSIILIAPGGKQILLSSRRGGYANFTATVFDDQATSPIRFGSAPFTGSFQPDQPLATLNGINPNGTWTLKVLDGAAGDVGTLNSWSLTILTGSEKVVFTDASGNYSLANLTQGNTYTVREIPPAHYLPKQPAANSYTVTVSGPSTGNDFGNAPLAINGQVYVDANVNGTQDSGEAGMAGVTVYLDANNNGILDGGDPSTSTDALGNYSFTNLTLGASYVVRVVMPSWESEITPAAGSWAGTMNGLVQGLNFGIAPVLSVGVSSNTLNIIGDNSSQVITLRLKNGAPSQLEVLANSTVFATIPVATFTSISVQLNGGNDSLTLDNSNGNPVPAGGLSYNGGTGSDTLKGPNSNSSWSLTGPNTGILNTATVFSNVEILAGGTGNDLYSFDSDSALGSETLSESGGIDTVNFSGTTTKAVAVNLGVATAQVVNSNLTLTLGSASTFENAIGGTLNDILTGNSLNNTLTGLPGNDTYVFDTDSALGNDTISESGVGTDTLDFSGTTTKAVAVNLGVATAQVVNSNLTLTLGSVSTIENVVGGSLNDSLTGNSLNNVLNGGAGNDTYSFDTDSALGNDTISESAGIDTLTFAATTTKGVAVNLGVGTAQVVNSNLTLTLGSASAIEYVVGGTQDDLLTGNSLNNILNGQTGNDTYFFDTDTALGNDTLGESGVGNDTLDFSGTTTKAVAVNLGVATAQSVNSNLTLTLGSASTIENVVGGSLNDSLTGNSLNNILGGKAGNDTYSFDTDSALGNDTLGEAGGIDTLTFAATTTKNVAINLGIATAQVVNSNLTLTLGSPATIEYVVGGTLNDTLTGNSLNNILNGQAGNDTYTFDTDNALGNDIISESGVGTDTLTFASTTTKGVSVNLGIATAQVVNSNLTLTLGSASTIEYVVGGTQDDLLTGNSLNNILNGQAGDDTYFFDTDSALGNDTISESGVGTDTLDFSATTTKAVAVNLGVATAQAVNSNLTLTLGSTSTIENVVATSLNDSLAGNSLNNTLNGGAGNDTYSFDTDSALGNDTISESTGTDTLTFASTTTQNVAVNLGVATAQVVNSNLTLTLGSASTIENVVGGTLDDSLTGNSLNNILNGQAGNDTYFFDTDTALGSDTIGESGVGIDTLAFGGTTTKTVTVNLGLATAQVVNSNLKLTLGSASTVENVLGGSLNDTLMGNSLNNILSGNAGNDSISGGDGRDILLGGAGADTLSGGNDEDVLLGALYSQANNVKVLNALMSEWGRTDLAYQQRIDHLTGANTVGANNGLSYLSTTTTPPTVTNDAAVDVETGNAALDWFFSHSGEDVTDASGETVTAIP